MTESEFRRTLRYYSIRVLIDTVWTVFLLIPFYTSYLWNFWWLKPIIIWYSPLTLFLLFHALHFVLTAVFYLIIALGKLHASQPLFLKFQLLLTYIFLKVFHGPEVHGLRNLPKGGGLVVYFHAPFIPVDLIYLFSHVYLKLGRMIGGSIDRAWHQNRLFAPLIEFFEYTSDRKEFIEGLKKGELKSVAPGGTYEAVFSKNCSVEWQSRVGFAKIAKITGVPVVPMFTTNLQQSMPLMDFSRSETMRKWYAIVKRPICIPKCYLPVKMRIFLGEPLICGENEEPEAFARRVKRAVESLRDKHQPPNQTCWNALRERFWTNGNA